MVQHQYAVSAIFEQSAQDAASPIVPVCGKAGRILHQRLGDHPGPSNGSYDRLSVF